MTAIFHIFLALFPRHALGGPTINYNSDEEGDISQSNADSDDPESISRHSNDSGSEGVDPDQEFKTEVTQSLERAFAEGHSVDNAAVELKTLRMASNVPLIRVKEAVIGALVDKIKLVEGDMAAQRKEIFAVIHRWGDLINKIGGVNAVETLGILQVSIRLRPCEVRRPTKFIFRLTAQLHLGFRCLLNSWRLSTKKILWMKTISVTGTDNPKPRAFTATLTKRLTISRDAG